MMRKRQIVEFTTFGEEVMKALSKYIKDAMRERDMNLSELATAAEVPLSTLSRYVNGTVKNPRASVLAKIARGLGLDWAMMMDLAGLTTGIPERARESIPGDLLALLIAQPWLMNLVRQIGDLPPGQQIAVIAFIRHLLDNRNGLQSAPEG